LARNVINILRKLAMFSRLSLMTDSELDNLHKACKITAERCDIEIAKRERGK